MATDAALEEAREDGDDVQAQTFSGRLLLRMPPTLHAALAREAERERTSLNRFIVRALVQALDPLQAAEHDVPEPEPTQRGPRLLGIALIANLVAIVVAAGIAIALLVIALTNG
jgi:HicB family